MVACEYGLIMAEERCGRQVYVSPAAICSFLTVQTGGRCSRRHISALTNRSFNNIRLEGRRIQSREAVVLCVILLEVSVWRREEKAGFFLSAS